MTHGFPQNPNPLFVNDFPIENRFLIENKRDMDRLKQILAQSPLLTKLSDFHLLLYLKELGILEPVIHLM